MQMVAKELLNDLTLEKDKAEQALKAVINRYDYSAFGGAPLLGIKGITIVCHGRSNPNAIKNAIQPLKDQLLAVSLPRVRQPQLEVGGGILLRQPDPHGPPGPGGHVQHVGAQPGDLSWVGGLAAVGHADCDRIRAWPLGLGWCPGEDASGRIDRGPGGRARIEAESESFIWQVRIGRRGSERRQERWSDASG